jgi:TetR/AcrR family transcriptional regulator
MASKLTAAPKSRDAERSRTAILDAAGELFAARGFDAVSLAEIGEAAGVSRATPAYFFGSKAGLYTAVLEHCFADALDAVRTGRVRAMRSGRPPAEVLAGAVSDYVDFVAAHPVFVRLIQRDALGEGPGTGELPLAQAVGAEAVDALAQELGFPPRARAAVRHTLLSLIALTWFPQLHGSTLVRALGFDTTAPGFADERKRHITALLIGALPTRTRQATTPRRSAR